MIAIWTQTGAAAAAAAASCQVLLFYFHGKNDILTIAVWPTTVHIFMAYGYYTINGSSHREIEIDFEQAQSALVIY